MSDGGGDRTVTDPANPSSDAGDGDGADQSDEGDGGDERDGHDHSRGTVCPFCGVGCRLDREGGRVRGRAGPANPGGRLCRHGLRAFDAVDDADRLTRPLVRRDGHLEPVDWATALDRVVAGFERILDDRGPDALAFLGAPRSSTEANYLLQKLARTLGTNNVDNRARICHAGTTRALETRLGRPGSTARLDDLPRADLFLVVGANPAERQPVAFNAGVRPAVAGGATLVHVDPHANETTRLADHHLAPRPGTDARLLSLLAALVVAGGGVDREFVAERTTGFHRFRAALGARGLATDAAACGVDQTAVRDVAAAVGAADRVVAMTGTGGDDPATADALVNLCLATGNVGRPGTGLLVLRGLTNEQGALDAGCAPDRLPGHRPVTDAAARDRLAAEWGRPVPTTPGRDERELVAAFGNDVAGALVVGENPAVSRRDPDELARALDGLDHLVVTELARSETTARADVVLPAAAGVERAGTVTNLDRQVQRLVPRAAPPGEARSDFAILRALGRRLVGDAFDHDGPRAAFAEFARVAPPYAGLTFDAVADGGRRWPAAGGAGGAGGGDVADGAARGDGADGAAGGSDGRDGRDDGRLYADSFDTADGRARFVPLSFADGGAAGAGATGGGAADGTVADGTVANDGSTADESSADRTTVDGTAAAERDDGRLDLVVGDRAGTFGTADDQINRSVTVHPRDARRRGLDDGDPVVVATGEARVETTVTVADAVRPGAVHLHAAVADPLVRGEDSRVRLRPRRESRDRDGEPATDPE